MDELISIIEDALMPAQGCTDPVSVAFAAAKARQELTGSGELEKLMVKVNTGLYKNAAHVTIPGTEDSGIILAAALGYLAGEAGAELQVLKNLHEAEITAAKELIATKDFDVEIDQEIDRLYIDLYIRTTEAEVRLVILDYYTNVVVIEKGKKIGTFQAVPQNKEEAGRHPIEKYSLGDLIEFSHQVKLERLNILQEGIDLSRTLAEEGLTKSDGLAATLETMQTLEDAESKLLQYPSLLASAASEARMTGSSNPAMSMAGSGNQGITAFLTVMGAAEALQTGQEELLRALALAVLISVYVKARLGVLSIMCGAGVAAGFGAGGGIVYLLGGGEDQIFQSALNLYGVLTGIICDGAKKGCAYKVAIASHWAVQSAILASKNIGLSPVEGMLADTLPELMDNLAKINCQGMAAADQEILDIMRSKETG